MKAELFHTRAQIEQMMGMMQQLHQAKSKDGGQQEEKSGGSGKGDAKDDSGGAGRAPWEERAACARVPATTETTAGGKCPATAAERRMDQDLPTTRLEIHFLLL